METRQTTEEENEVLREELRKGGAMRDLPRHANLRVTKPRQRGMNPVTAICLTIVISVIFFGAAVFDATEMVAEVVGAQLPDDLMPLLEGGGK